MAEALRSDRPVAARVAILDDYTHEALQIADWSGLPAGTEVEAFAHAARSEDELAARLADFDVVVAMRERTAFGATLLERLPRLRLIATTGLRNAAIDLAACARLGIDVCGAPGARTGLAGTAETAWALLLALHKKTVASHVALCRGEWQPEMAEVLSGRTLGLVGLGHIGQQMARIGNAFGMQVVAWSPNLTDERAEAAGARRVDKAGLFSQADAVSLHLVLAPSTRGVVGAAELALMKPGAYLVNTARAALVDEAALLDALAARRIGGAGLDVFWQEPVPAGHALCALPNVVLSPHLGYVTRDNMAAFYAGVVRNIALWLDGGAPVPLKS
jgi:phosphoglycerate dehydrogenase-like enzyme